MKTPKCDREAANLGMNPPKPLCFLPHTHLLSVEMDLVPHCSNTCLQLFCISGSWYFRFLVFPPRSHARWQTQTGAEVTSYTVVIRELKFRFLIALSRPYYLLIRVFWELHQTYNNKHSFPWKFVAAVAALQPFCNGTRTNQPGRASLTSSEAFQAGQV